MPKTKQKRTKTGSKATKKRKKTSYFKVDKFVDDVITSMDLGKVAAPVLLELKNAVADRLADRILFTVTNSFRERELKMFENMLNDHPELDELDVLWLVAHDVEGLKEKLTREINSLYSELVYDAEKIGEALKPLKS